jgi:hypothetical protein
MQTIRLIKVQHAIFNKTYWINPAHVKHITQEMNNHTRRIMTKTRLENSTIETYTPMNEIVDEMTS